MGDFDYLEHRSDDRSTLTVVSAPRHAKDAARKRRRLSAVDSLAAIIEVCETRQMLSAITVGVDGYAAQTQLAESSYVAPIQESIALPTQMGLEQAALSFSATVAAMTSQANQTTLDLPAGLETLVANVEGSSPTDASPSDSSQSGASDSTSSGSSPESTISVTSGPLEA